MTQESCVFCALIAGKLPTAIIEDTESMLVIKDRAPKAPIHYLIIPKKHIRSCADLGDDDRALAAEILYTAQRIAQTFPGGSQDFRLIMNNGALVGQSVFHLHAHFITGKQLTDF